MFAFSHNSKKRDKGPIRKKKQKRQLSQLQRQLIFGIVIALIIAILIVGIFYGSRIASLQIIDIQVVGGETIPHSQIKERVRSSLSGTYLGLIPNTFIPLYPKNRIEASIQDFDRVKNVRAELTPNQTLTVIFDEHVPYALWCEAADTELCFFMDKKGLAFASAPTLEGSAFVRYVDEGMVPAKDAYGFEDAFVKDTEEFIALLQDQLSLYTTHVVKKGTYDVEYTISGGGVIKVSQSISMQESFENLQTILNSDEFKHIEPGTFQYIDLRFGDKVFVNEAIAAPEYEAATSSDAATST